MAVWTGTASAPRGLRPLIGVRVRIDEDGLHVRGRPPVPVDIPLDQIEVVEVIDVNPWRWSGWGYRGSLKVFRRAAFVARRGPGIKVTLKDGRVFVVTVDDAEEGARVLRGLLTSTPR